MVTQKDISVACGVSVAAVSRALNGHGDISAGTSKRIIDAAEKMGYVKRGKRIKKERTYLIGILFTEKELSEFHNDIVMEIREHLMERGYDILILNPAEKESGMVEKPGYLSRARLMGLEGVLLFSSIPEEEFCLSPEHRGLRELVFGDIPVVAVDCAFASCACVRPACEEGIRELFGYFYGLGHRRIAFFSRKKTSQKAYLEGELRTMANEDGRNLLNAFFCFYETKSEGEAAAKTAEILGDARWLPPTCLIYEDSGLLQGSLACIRNAGFRIPEDVSVAAMSYRSGEFFDGKVLTSWTLPPSRIANEAVNMILREISKPGLCSGQTLLVKGAMTPGETAVSVGLEAAGAG